MDEFDISQGLVAFLEARDAYGNKEQLRYWKQVYYRLYNRQSKREQRKRFAQVTLLMPHSMLKELRTASVIARMPVSRYITDSALAYTRKTKLVMHTREIAELRQILSQIASDIRYLVSKSDGNSIDTLQALIQRVYELEDMLQESLNNISNVPIKSSYGTHGIIP